MKHAVLGNIATFGILGNHDYGFNWSETDVAINICDIMKNSGVQMLNNAQSEISGLNFIGFEDLWSPNFDPLQVMKDYDETKANLVLCHNPDVCDLDVWNGYKGWILSGHTHGDNVEFRELLHQFCQSKIKNTSPEKSICKMAGCYISTGQ